MTTRSPVATDPATIFTDLEAVAQRARGRAEAELEQQESVEEIPPEQAASVAVGRAVREARGLTLEALADEAKITPDALSAAEQGRLRLTSSQHFALETALHVPMGLLFSHGADLSGLRRL